MPESPFNASEMTFGDHFTLETVGKVISGRIERLHCHNHGWTIDVRTKAGEHICLIHNAPAIRKEGVTTAFLGEGRVFSLRPAALS